MFSGGSVVAGLFRGSGAISGGSGAEARVRREREREVEAADPAHRDLSRQLRLLVVAAGDELFGLRLWCDARSGRPLPAGRDPVIAALGKVLAIDPEHLEARRLMHRREFLLARALARGHLLAGRPFDALSLLDVFREAV